MIEEVTYKNRNNTIELALEINGVAVNHTTLTKYQLKVGGAVVDSDVNPEYFDMTQTDRIILKLGESGLAFGKYTATLIVFNSSSPLGIVWGDLMLSILP